MIRRILINLFGMKISGIESLSTMPTDILISFLFERGTMLMRGLFRLRMLCFLGRGVTLRGKKRIKIGKFVTIHDYSYIDARSLSGVILEDYCSIGRNSFIRSGNLASHDGYLIMRSRSSCNFNCFLGATGGLVIGKNVLIGPNVTIITEKHIYDETETEIRDQGISRAPVNIEDNVWIGANVVILGGNTVHTGSIIGAGSILTKSVEQMAIVAGNPAKFLKMRDRK